MYFYFFVRGSSKYSYLDNFLVSYKEKKKSQPEKILDQQTDTNKKILSTLEGLSDGDKERFLTPLQVENANICPSDTFNTEDPFCLRCEWLVNCSLRKVKEKKSE